MKKKWEAPIKLARYMGQGYVLNIPGGKSLDGGHASFGFETMVGISGKVEIRIVGYNPYIKSKPKEEEHVLYPLESPEQTLGREWEEEIGVRPLVAELLGKREIPNKRNQEEIHTQYVFRVYGSDATEVKRSFPSPAGRITEPFFVPLWYLKVNLFVGHQWMLSLLIPELEKEYPEMMLN